MKQQEKDDRKRKLSKGAASGATAIIFLFIGFQAAIFVLKVLERPPVVEPAQEESKVIISPPGERKASGSRGVAKPAMQIKPKTVRKVESFRFDPNLVTLEELVRLGLSEKQAGAILNYREKGGKFRTKEDFKKMYTVSDSLYQRLESFIDIPKMDINSADSAQLVSLRGIGPYYARKIIAYRDALGGYYCKEQLMEIKGIDEEKFSGFEESIIVDTTKIIHFTLDTISEEALTAHPYIGKIAARAIVRLRGLGIVNDSILMKESILDETQTERVKNYVIFVEN